MAKDGSFSIPTIKGRIAEKLARATPRAQDGEEPLEFPPSPAQLSVHDADERGALALACLILESLRERGGTRVPRRPLETVLRKSLASFGPKEVMDIEVEAYEILLWLGKAIDPQWSQQPTEDGDAVDNIHQDSPHHEIIRWAIANAQDLEMDYYSHGRGQFTKRRITPISLEAETYLHAYCHLRRGERVFRLTRIADLRPVGGWSAFRKARQSSSGSAPGPTRKSSQDDKPENISPSKPEPNPPPEESPDSNPQMSLLDPE